MNWIRVDSGERPEDGEEVRVKTVDGNECRAIYNNPNTDISREKVGLIFLQEVFWRDYDGVRFTVKPTHWAHLPEPPLSDAEHHETAPQGPEREE